MDATRTPPEPENWLPVVGFEDYYEVSDHGNVRTLRRKGTRGGPLAQHPNHRGYLTVNLRAGGKRLHRGVHRLVIEAFIGPPPEGTECRHLDGDSTNNLVGNLAWGTASENSYDRVRHGTDRESRKTHCPQGHPYDESNTQVRPNGWRHCRACRRASDRRYRAARKLREVPNV